MKTRLSPRQILIALTASIGLTTGAFAMPPQGEMSNGPAGRMHERHMARGMKEMVRLHEDLKLDAKQEALWKEAETASQANRTAMHERFGKHREEIRNLLAQPGTDLRTVAKRMSEFRAEGQKLHEADMERWLAVYDSLGAGQKEKARLFFKARLERFDHFGKSDAPRK